MINKDKFSEIFSQETERFLREKQKAVSDHVGFESKGYVRIRLYSAEVLREFSEKVLVPALEEIIKSKN